MRRNADRQHRGSLARNHSRHTLLGAALDQEENAAAATRAADFGAHSACATGYFHEPVD
jgi:hypothetical protein